MAALDSGRGICGAVGEAVAGSCCPDWDGEIVDIMVDLGKGSESMVLETDVQRVKDR